MLVLFSKCSPGRCGNAATEIMQQPFSPLFVFFGCKAPLEYPQNLLLFNKRHHGSWVPSLPWGVDPQCSNSPPNLIGCPCFWSVTPQCFNIRQFSSNSPVVIWRERNQILDIQNNITKEGFLLALNPFFSYVPYYSHCLKSKSLLLLSSSTHEFV